jgi:DNA-binding GntR family transcriptional regulator
MKTLAENKLDNRQISFLMRLYNEQPLDSDKLPYTKTFDRLVKSFHAEFGKKFGHHVLWHTIKNLRKQKKLMRKTLSK